MNRVYPIFVPPVDINEAEMEHAEVVDWCYKNLSSSNVLPLNYSDVYLLQYETQILDIINEENNGMLQLGEDDWIIPEEVKQKILQRLKFYKGTIENAKGREIANRIIDLLEISIRTGRNLYFIF